MSEEGDIIRCDSWGILEEEGAKEILQEFERLASVMPGKSLILVNMNRVAGVTSGARRVFVKLCKNKKIKKLSFMVKKHSLV